MRIRNRIAIAGTIALYLFGLVGYGWHDYQTEQKRLMADLESRLRSAAQIGTDNLGPTYHDDIEAISRWSREQELAVSERLDRIASALGVRYVYTFVRIKDRLYFTSDSDIEEVRKNGIWKEYTEATAQYREAFVTEKPFVAEVHDRWGDFLSLAVPMRSANGTVYLVGADITLEHVNALLSTTLLQSVATAAFFLLLLIPVGLTYIAQLREQNRELEHLVGERTQRIEALIDQTKKFLPPQVYKEIVGGRKEITQQRRVKLTLFFSDVKDFTAITDQLEAEELAQLLNQYLDEMSHIALKYGGTIDKYVGDAIMVFFGAPEFVSDEHHARQCVSMALEMRCRLRELRAEWALRGFTRSFHVRMGISTGYCTVGSFGSEFKMDYTAVGTIVNLAARLQSIAPPDGILIAQETYLLCQDQVDARTREEIQIRGFHAPVQSYEIVALREASIPPYLRKTHDGFALRPLVWEPGALNAAETEQLKRDLTDALEALNGAQPAKSKLKAVA